MNWTDYDMKRIIAMLEDATRAQEKYLKAQGPHFVVGYQGQAIRTALEMLRNLAEDLRNSESMV
jgi:hypothetical protein